MKIWFSSDHHFYHTNVIKYCNRPFSTVEEMNEEMVRRWNTLVSPGDLVYYLGDFSLSRRAAELFVPRLNGNIFLIAGNHDHCHPAHAKKPEKQKKMISEYLRYGFQSVVTDYYTLAVDQDLNLLLCHMPYSGDSGDKERYAKYRPKDQGMWLLHGHVHNAWKVKGRQINVGADVWSFAPVSLDEILAIVRPTK